MPKLDHNDLVALDVIAQGGMPEAISVSLFLSGLLWLSRRRNRLELSPRGVTFRVDHKRRH